MPTLADVVNLLEDWFDPAYAESWDAVGLVSGDPTAPVSRIHVAVDPTEAVALEAVEAGADLLLTHHPLFLRGVNGVPATTAGGRVIRTLIAGGCALFSAHTNADVAAPGVSDALLATLGASADVAILRPAEPLALHGLVVHVPVADAPRVLAAATAAGAGRLGHYDSAAFGVAGTGQFRPLPAATPHLGEIGALTEVNETRLECVVSATLLPFVLAAIAAAHPYEAPSVWNWPLTIPSGRGLGRVGSLPAPVPLGEFVAVVARSLPVTVAGVRASGDPLTPVSRVAVVGGSGSDLSGLARAAAADVLVTADTRHHTGLDASLPIVDVAHWASEWPWCAAVAQRLRDALGRAANVSVSTRVTDPWTVHACPSSD